MFFDGMKGTQIGKASAYDGMKGTQIGKVSAYDSVKDIKDRSISVGSYDQKRIPLTS